MAILSRGVRGGRDPPRDFNLSLANLLGNKQYTHIQTDTQPEIEAEAEAEAHRHTHTQTHRHRHTDADTDPDTCTHAELCLCAMPLATHVRTYVVLALV